MPFSSERPYAARSTCDPSSRTILAAYVFSLSFVTSSFVCVRLRLTCWAVTPCLISVINITLFFHIFQSLVHLPGNCFYIGFYRINYSYQKQKQSRRDNDDLSLPSGQFSYFQFYPPPDIHWFREDIFLEFSLHFHLFSFL